MDQSLGFLFAAFLVTWLTLLLYLLSLSGRINAVRRELDALKRRDQESSSGKSVDTRDENP
jgi:CcmD family protein